jgi:hypothetical protein
MAWGQGTAKGSSGPAMGSQWWTLTLGLGFTHSAIFGPEDSDSLPESKRFALLDRVVVD